VEGKVFVYGRETGVNILSFDKPAAVVFFILQSSKEVYSGDRSKGNSFGAGQASVRSWLGLVRKMSANPRMKGGSE